MKICDFTQTEADYLETVCNFTHDENTLFQLRLKDISLDSVKQLSRKVNDKIKREA